MDINRAAPATFSGQVDIDADRRVVERFQAGDTAAFDDRSIALGLVALRSGDAAGAGERDRVGVALADQVGRNVEAFRHIARCVEATEVGQDLRQSVHGAADDGVAATIWGVRSVEPSSTTTIS